MLEYLTLILICQLAGELTVNAAGLPVPGPVVGMVLLFVILLVIGSVPEGLDKVSTALLENLSLMFVPAGVGIMAHFELLGNNAWPLAIAVLLSTVLTIIVTALVMQRFNKRSNVAETCTI